MSVEKLRKLKNSRKWFQFCKGILKTINLGNNDVIYNLYLESIAQYHPLSITETTLAISNLILPVESLTLIEKSIETIKENNMYTGDFKVQIIHLEIKKNLFRVEQNEFEGVERMLYELKHTELPPTVYELYNYLGFKYFEKTGNIDYCINYLLKYIELSGDQTLYTLLAKYTLVSQNFFNFIKVSSLPDFPLNPLHKIYALVQNGDTQGVLKEVKGLEKIFGEEYKVVVEKTYFVGLINLCFEEKSREISLSKVQDTLKINEIHPFILRAFGLGLLKGWVDETNNKLYFSTILPRTLPNEELEKMKEKFSIWRRKVRETILMIEK